MMQQKTIVLVEDNPDEQELLLLACERGGLSCEFVVLSDGAEALNYLLGNYSQPQQKPALVLLDFDLPKINGLEVLHKLRSCQKTQGLPVIMLSVSAEPQDITNSYLCGCNSYIHKSIDFNEFQSRICELIHDWVGK